MAPVVAPKKRKPTKKTKNVKRGGAEESTNADWVRIKNSIAQKINWFVDEGDDESDMVMPLMRAVEDSRKYILQTFTDDETSSLHIKIIRDMLSNIRTGHFKQRNLRDMIKSFDDKNIQ